MIRLFRVFVPASTLGLVVFETVVVIAAFIFSLDLLIDTDLADYLLNDLGLVKVALITVSILAGMYFQDLYSSVRVTSKLLLALQLVMMTGIAFMVQALLSAAELHMPLLVMVLGSVLSIVTMLTGRLMFDAYVLPRAATERLVLLGDSLLLSDIAMYLEQSPQVGIQVIGRIRESDLSNVAVDDTGGHTSAPKLEELIRVFNSNRVVVGMNDGMHSWLASALLELRFLGYSVQDAAETYAKICNRETLIGMGPIRLLYSKEFEPDTRFMFFQLIIHSLVAAFCIVLLLPVMLLIGLLVWLSSRGPVVEKRVRAGRNGVPFPLCCFRVHTVDGSTGSAVSRDRLGRILARTGLYALPQFFNVLLGQMSIVGPRPQTPEFIRELSEQIPFYPHRLKMRPGMTGFAQIQARRKSRLPDSIAELEYDLYYLKYASPAMDMFVTVQAIKNILLWGGQP